MSNSQPQMPRRAVLRLAWGAAGLLALGEASFAGLKFLAPRVGEGEFGAEIAAGPADSYLPGSVTEFNAGRFYLVRMTDGGFIALYRRCPHLGCSVPYDAERGEFVCPCHGSAFTQDGAVINPPAPRPLDSFAIRIENGEVFIDTSRPVEREPNAPVPLVYA